MGEFKTDYSERLMPIEDARNAKVECSKLLEEVDHAAGEMKFARAVALAGAVPEAIRLLEKRIEEAKAFLRKREEENPSEYPMKFSI